MEGFLEILRKVTIIAVLVGLFLIVIYSTNKRLFIPKQDTISIQKADIPLSRSTVEFDYRVFKDAVKKTSWADLNGNVLEADDDDDLKNFNERINRNRMAEALANMYPDQFEWNTKEGKLKMPRSGKYILVPTWVLYEFIGNIDRDIDDDDDD